MSGKQYVKFCVNFRSFDFEYAEMMRGERGENTICMSSFLWLALALLLTVCRHGGQNIICTGINTQNIVSMGVSYPEALYHRAHVYQQGAFDPPVMCAFVKRMFLSVKLIFLERVS